MWANGAKFNFTTKVIYVWLWNVSPRTFTIYTKMATSIASSNHKLVSCMCIQIHQTAIFECNATLEINPRITLSIVVFQNISSSTLHLSLLLLFQMQCTLPANLPCTEFISLCVRVCASIRIYPYFSILNHMNLAYIDQMCFRNTNKIVRPLFPPIFICVFSALSIDHAHK